MDDVKNETKFAYVKKFLYLCRKFRKEKISQKDIGMTLG